MMIKPTRRILLSAMQANRLHCFRGATTVLLLRPNRQLLPSSSQQHVNNYSTDRRFNNDYNEDERRGRYDENNRPYSRGYSLIYKILAAGAIGVFSMMLYENIYKEERFNKALEAPARNNNNNNNIGDDQYDLSSGGNTLDLSMSAANEEQMTLFKSFLRDVAKERDVLGVIQLQNKDQNEELRQLALLNQSNSNRDLDVIFIDSINYQQQFQSHVTNLYKVLNNFENTARMRVLKGTNNNRPLILLFSNINAADNNVLDVLRIYAKRWSSDPDRFGISIVFSGTTVKYRFKDDQPRFWDFESVVTSGVSSSSPYEGMNDGYMDNSTISDEYTGGSSGSSGGSDSWPFDNQSPENRDDRRRR